MKLTAWRMFPAEEGWAPAVSLTNLLVAIYFVLQEPPFKLAAGLLLVLLFAVAYREIFWRSQQAPLLLGCQLAILLVLTAFYHPMFAYIGFLMSLSLSRQKQSFMVGISVVFVVGTILAAIPHLKTMGPVILIMLLPPIFGVAIVPFIMRASARYKQMAERLQAATSQLERMAQQEERQRIARELHDTLGHTLSLISLKGELTEKLITRDPDRALTEARDIRETARAALKQMRELVTEMKVVRLVEEYQHAKTLCAAADIRLQFEQHAVGGEDYAGKYTEADTFRSVIAVVEALPLSPLQETILAMCFREVITNVVRHSQAKACTAILHIEEGQVRLAVEDNGIGLDKNAQYRAGSSGMTGLKQRLALVDGRLQIDSAPQAGTSINLIIPRVLRSEQRGEVG
ncbi:sensor histidine kinase [Paenibacillus sp. ACRRX]|uniref:sensor histidine kinase n=1 Tax=Paenibacillus sp. ACRRX TaxID=2918206 RepID=UPI001EF661A5|nr:sensor histidine kinase [Paenibacillus sp. ACRRX]